jgi:hypothetical protein
LEFSTKTDSDVQTNQISADFGLSVALVAATEIVAIVMLVRHDPARFSNPAPFPKGIRSHTGRSPRFQIRSSPAPGFSLLLPSKQL